MQSAVLLAVPEAEPLVSQWRAKGDPSAAHGVPAHVTLLYPFLPAEQVDDGVLGELAWFFKGVDSFPVRFTRVARWEHVGVVYLAPESDVLTQLTRSLARRWPECPPYSGEIPVDELIPHLTIVHTDDRALRQSAANDVSPKLPLKAVAREASLWVRGEDDEWTVRQTFPFGPAE
ncbi:MAG: 2'-5' RNA ligase family protein [Actinobacteria bacterium]|nr:2'-5' RNA ligase family protein [Actinomycetota bacterium]MCA1721972.1 2'-5' RNA ligase family protein [Actinomycetota bacterium]